MADKKKTRKWVVRAIVAFLVIMLLLTFFSNTIMNATIPKVVAEYSQRGTLSFAHTAKSTVDIVNKVEYKVPKDLAGRKIKSVDVTNYDMGEKDKTVAVTLETVDEEDETLQQLKDELKSKLDEKKYDERTPEAEDTSIKTAEESVQMYQDAVTAAQNDLNLAQNRDGTIAAAQATIDANSPALAAATAEFDAASASVETIQGRMSEIDTEIANLQDKLVMYEIAGQEIPEPTPPGSAPVTPEPNTPLEVIVQMDNLNAEKANLAESLEDAQTRVNNSSAEKTRLEGIIGEATGIIEGASSTKTVEEAQKALDEANKSLAEARKSLSDAQVNAGINRDKSADAKQKANDEIEKLQKKIEKIEENNKITEIKCPASGYITNITASEGATLTEDDKLFAIIPEDPKGEVKFSFKTEDVRGMAQGQELVPDSSEFDKCIIKTIKPDPDDPRGTRIVVCEVKAEYLYQDEPITVTAGKSNDQYDCIVPSSAVIKDNSGNFVYALVESSTPLGSKFTVKKIDVEIENSDGARTAIKGEKLDDKYQYVTRSEEPLKDGDRVRLQDYSKKE